MLLPYIFTFIFGLAIGSFLNVCIYRIPLNQSIVKPRSHCPKCNELIAWYDNIPLLSYLILQGKCRHCKTPISIRYFIVELLTGILFVLVAWKFGGFNFVSVTYIVIVGCLIAITFIDLDHFIIPDVITYPCMILGIAISLILSFYDSLGFLINRVMSGLCSLLHTDQLYLFYKSLFSLHSPEFLINDVMSGPFLFTAGRLYPFYNALFGLVIGGGILLLIGSTAKWILKKEAMGGGDVKLLAAMGTFLGYKLVLLTLILASFVGSIIGAIVLIQAKKEEQAATPFGHYIPFGPYLAIGAYIALLWGNEIINWYFNNLLGFGELPPGVR